MTKKGPYQQVVAQLLGVVLAAERVWQRRIGRASLLMNLGQAQQQRRCLALYNGSLALSGHAQTPPCLRSINSQVRYIWYLGDGFVGLWHKGSPFFMQGVKLGL